MTSEKPASNGHLAGYGAALLRSAKMPWMKQDAPTANVATPTAKPLLPLAPTSEKVAQPQATAKPNVPEIKNNREIEQLQSEIAKAKADNEKYSKQVHTDEGFDKWDDSFHKLSELTQRLIDLQEQQIRATKQIANNTTDSPY